ncbi:TraB family protein [compost metagenome]
MLLFQTCLAFAQEPSSLLWKVSGKNLKSPSYLFGTIHLICEKDYQQPSSLNDCFSQTKQVYLELDMDDPRMMPDMQEQMAMSDGQSLQTIMNADDYQLVNTFFKDSLGISLDFFKTTKPVLLTSMIIIKMMNGCKTESYEMNFVRMAKEQQKEVLGLETVKEQMAVLELMPVKQQADELLKSIKDYGNYKIYFQQLIDAYKAQDVAKIYQLSTEGAFASSTNDNEILINSRNKNWIPKIVKTAAERPTFFAVGIGHLGGPQGVIELLRKKGYTVEPVR